MVVFYWADGCWCKEEDVEDMMHKGDMPFDAIMFEDDLSDKDIEMYVRQEIAQ